MGAPRYQKQECLAEGKVQCNATWSRQEASSTRSGTHQAGGALDSNAD